MQLEQRYDLAFMSTKGLSVTAARLLVDRLCAKYNIPLFLLRDFDKSGFVGAGTFQKSNRRYTYKNTFKVFDLGLRLDDVYDLVERFPDLGDIDTLAEIPTTSARLPHAVPILKPTVPPPTRSHSSSLTMTVMEMMMEMMPIPAVGARSPRVAASN